MDRSRSGCSEDPTLIQQELDRRLAVARAADPTKARQHTVQRELVRVDKSIDRLLTAYQEGLVSLEQLRERMPRLREREQTLRTELRAITEQIRDRAAYLRLAETLSAFLTRVQRGGRHAGHRGATTDHTAGRQGGARRR